MDASIYRDNGTLVIDFRTPQCLDKNRLHRDVEIVFSNPKDNNIITVAGKKANFICQPLCAKFLMDFDIYDEKNINAVLPEYVEEFDYTYRNWYGWKVTERIRRVKPGFFEMKNTNNHVEIITTKYIIYK